jgi:hypothetical protein
VTSPGGFAANQVVGPRTHTVDHALYLLVLGLGCVLVVLRPVLVRTERPDWALIAAGVVRYCLADLLWLAPSGGHGAPAPSPWPNALRIAVLEQLRAAFDENEFVCTTSRRQ